MTPKMCWIGVGNMGKAMSRNLALKADLDSPLILWSRNGENAKAHSLEVGNTVAMSSLTDVVQAASIIWSTLRTQEAVAAVYDEILQTDIQGKTFVECSTNGVQFCDELANKVVSKGAEFVAMPVFGEPSMAAAGVLTLVPSGAASAVAKVKPYLVGVLGRALIDFGGENPGKGEMLKVIGNVFIINMIETLAEGHVLAEKAGLGSDSLEKFVETVFPGPFVLHSKRMTTQAYHKTEPIATVAMAKKVASHVRELADSSGTVLPAYEAAQKNLELLEQRVGSQADIDGLYGAIRLQSGLPYEKE